MRQRKLVRAIFTSRKSCGFSLKTALVGGIALSVLASAGCGSLTEGSQHNADASSHSAQKQGPAHDSTQLKLTAGFTWQSLEADTGKAFTMPPTLDKAGEVVEEPLFGLQLVRATDAIDAVTGGDATDAQTSGGTPSKPADLIPSPPQPNTAVQHLRHEYSRRQAFNADNSLYLVQDSSGHWHLYNGKTFQYRRLLKPLAGDCEPLWDPTNPKRLYFTSTNGGTWAFSLDFSEKRKLTNGSEHSDLVFAADRSDYLVYADYQLGQIHAVQLANGHGFDLHTLYPAVGEAYAVHISGQATQVPGWVVISTYGESSDYGQGPVAHKRAEYRKIWLQEVASQGRSYNLSPTYTVVPEDTKKQGEPAYDGETERYFLEPQASVSRDLTRVIFASNFGTDRIESYILLLDPTSLPKVK